ncbi:hypothetical protein QBC46DRAFT_120565 [Diplogelasinospora grovesii]|uniref:Secreted protein n=1 Tax=Diplogelasinospora grovesii TaxID=303347 RepID=A0AAN6S519_9PEZI|nr:hypothetical protein QBC46DRAFT_120565 [Diplogelasinospora grovesii]
MVQLLLLSPRCLASLSWSLSLACVGCPPGTCGCFYFFPRAGTCASCILGSSTESYRGRCKNVVVPGSRRRLPWLYKASRQPKPYFPSHVLNTRKSLNGTRRQSFMRHLSPYKATSCLIRVPTVPPTKILQPHARGPVC